MFHYTSTDSGKAIESQKTWCFRAEKPPGGNPTGAYFTTLRPSTPKLAERLRIPRRKIEFVFSFSGDSGLEPLRGGRGSYIFYSSEDYLVEPERQLFHGSLEEALKVEA